MNSKLARVLIERNVIQRGTLLETDYNARGISGQYNARISGSFKLIGAKATGDLVYFETIGPDGERHRIVCDDVMSVDGMPLERIAGSQQLTLDGEKAIPVVRRGRRRKGEGDEWSEDMEI